MAPAQHDVTGLLLDFGAADREELDRVFPVVYDELRRVARRALSHERSGHTLTTTALVHEAYLELVDQASATSGKRARFFAIAATAMRRVLVEYARRHRALKRGGGLRRVSLDENAIASVRADALLALDEALTRLGALNERLARVVECRYFAGLSEEETAEVLDVTERTVRRDWVKARAWLLGELHEPA